VSTLDPMDVLETIAGMDARPVRLPDATVLRTQGRPDAVAGNVLLRRVPVTAATLDHTVADVRNRFGHPQTAARFITTCDSELLAAAADRDDLRCAARALVTLDEPVATTAGWIVRDDVAVGPPPDDRGWHAVAVLHRHAGRDADEAARRSRGDDDDRLRWWVDGQRQLVALGRARLVRAERFGTPVGCATLAWEPRIDVGPDHAGLAVLHDLIVHPAHRQIGVATTMLTQLVNLHLRDFPRARVAAVIDAELVAGAEALGMRAVAALLDVTVL
jgi:GNAT superfamily N-acetyltransferase